MRLLLREERPRLGGARPSQSDPERTLAARALAVSPNGPAYASVSSLWCGAAAGEREVPIQPLPVFDDAVGQQVDEGADLRREEMPVRVDGVDGVDDELDWPVEG